MKFSADTTDVRTAPSVPHNGYIRALKQIIESPWNVKTKELTSHGRVLTSSESLRTTQGYRCDGTTWAFRVWGPEVSFTSPGKKEFTQNDMKYVLQNFYFSISHFQIASQRVHCSCGCKRVETIICLPDKLASMCTEVLEYGSAKRPLLYRKFLAEMSFCIGNWQKEIAH